jgi:hypothetical protein
VEVEGLIMMLRSGKGQGAENRAHHVSPMEGERLAETKQL